MNTEEKEDELFQVSARPHPFRFRKGSRLRHRTLVEGLFAKGKSIYDYPIRAVWRIIDGEELENSFRNGAPKGIDRLQMMVTVPKKKRRHAVDRVLMRRRIREAYRLNRAGLQQTLDLDSQNRFLEVAFIYLHDANLPYADVERKMKSIINKLASKLVVREN